MWLSKQLNHITFIDKPTAFTDSNYGMLFGARVIPVENKNTFTFATWININIIDLAKWSLFAEKIKYQVNPAILISPKEWSTCGSKIDIRFSSLYDRNDSKDLNGTFNIVNGIMAIVLEIQYITISNGFIWQLLVITKNYNIGLMEI